MAPQLIGISGYARSGKDTAGAALIHDGFVQHAFAAPLKDAALRADPIIGFERRRWWPFASPRPVRLAPVVDAIGWERAKDEHPEARRILVGFATDAIRTIDPTFWTRMARQAIEASLEAGHDVVVTDCRFVNEADTVRDLGGRVLRVDRPGVVPAPDAGESEFGLDSYDFDARITNDQGIEELHDAVRRIVAARPRLAA